MGIIQRKKRITGMLILALFAATPIFGIQLAIETVSDDTLVDVLSVSGTVEAQLPKDGTWLYVTPPPPTRDQITDKNNHLIIDRE